VKEYLDLGRGHDARTSRPLEGIECRVCERVASEVPAAGSRRRILRAPVSGGRAVATGEARAPAYEPIGEAWSAGATPAPYVDDPAVDPGSVRSSEPVVSSVPPPTEPVASAAPTPVAEPAAPSPILEPTPAPAIEPSPAPAAPPIAPPRAARLDPAAEARDAPPVMQRASADPIGPTIAQWLLLLASAALIAQLVALGLRPLRRLLTLRHLRRPFWDETIAQRVSNSWQLALVGLRDAGWRAGQGEAPHELARRTGVEGLDRCATILERARHGIGIDAEDLAEMHASAGTAYRAARQGVGRCAGRSRRRRWRPARPVSSSRPRTAAGPSSSPTRRSTRRAGSPRRSARGHARAPRRAAASSHRAT
jgi:hypothetical protein